jgi:hypothetical protein
MDLMDCNLWEPLFPRCLFPALENLSVDSNLVHGFETYAPNVKQLTLRYNSGGHYIVDTAVSSALETFVVGKYYDLPAVEEANGYVPLVRTIGIGAWYILSASDDRLDGILRSMDAFTRKLYRCRWPALKCVRFVDVQFTDISRFMRRASDIEKWSNWIEMWKGVGVRFELGNGELVRLPVDPELTEGDEGSEDE